ncbi:hypothetical protein G5S34_17260 [Herbaspirillum frisingense]|uniref:hypothetical protein n=1 Tax=Herbaspirillum frisingense TaxID=92645 RepID=UPI0016042F70|nr:hypothetical protein [Herbaspirillum frisingense]QNB08329.1 hypothetical protein G5S34_17260 [Herbaspirillum frisingense]
MRYRKEDADGDYVFGRQELDFLKDSPDAVAQAVDTRLKLLKGEWFVDTSDGTPWSTEVLGKNTQSTYDAAIRQRILRTPGVLRLTAYSSTADPETRHLSVNATIDTIYGTTQVQSLL